MILLKDGTKVYHDCYSCEHVYFWTPYGKDVFKQAFCIADCGNPPTNMHGAIFLCIQAMKRKDITCSSFKLKSTFEEATIINCQKIVHYVLCDTSNGKDFTACRFYEKGIDHYGRSNNCKYVVFERNPLTSEHEYDHFCSHPTKE